MTYEYIIYKKPTELWLKENGPFAFQFCDESVKLTDYFKTNTKNAITIFDEICKAYDNKYFELYLKCNKGLGFITIKTN